MTKTYEEIEIETKTVKKKLTAITCDWCDGAIPLVVRDCSSDIDIETDISFHEIHLCGNEYSCGDVWEVEDLCLACGRKLKQLLLDAGIKVSEYDW